MGHKKVRFAHQQSIGSVLDQEQLHHAETSATGKTSSRANELTSIGLIHRHEILLIKLTGGFLFDWPNRWLALVYRVAVIFGITFLINVNTNSKLIGLRKARATMSSLLLYGWVLEKFAYFAVNYNIYLDFRRHANMRIILDKRLDSRYLNQLEPANGARQTRSTPNIKFLRRSVSIFFLIAVSSHFILEETLDFIGSCSMYQEAKKSGANFSSYIDSWTPASQSGWNISTDCSISSLFEQKRLYLRQSSIARVFASYFVEKSVQLARIALSKLMEISYFSGQMYIQTMIIATMTDMVSRISEQDELVSKSKASNRETRRSHRRSTQERDQRPRLEIPTVLMLVQVRDVLITLRESFGLNYMCIFISQMVPIVLIHGLTLGMFKLGLAQVGTILIAMIAERYFEIMIHRLVYQRLQDEVDKIGETSQLRLVRDVASESHVESRAILKLTEDIGQISPTDWIEPDIKALMVTVLSAFAFIVGVHQITEKSIAIRLSGRNESRWIY